MRKTPARRPRGLAVFGSARARGLFALSPLRREENHPAWSDEPARSEGSQEREGGISLLLFTAIFLADLLIK